MNRLNGQARQADGTDGAQTAGAELGAIKAGKRRPPTREGRPSSPPSSNTQPPARTQTEGGEARNAAVEKRSNDTGASCLVR